MTVFAGFTLALLCAIGASSFVGQVTKSSDWAGATFFALLALIFVGGAITVAIKNLK